jgi:hypothetical protein
MGPHPMTKGETNALASQLQWMKGPASWGAEPNLVTAGSDDHGPVLRSLRGRATSCRKCRGRRHAGGSEGGGGGREGGEGESGDTRELQKYIETQATGMQICLLNKGYFIITHHFV